MKIHSVNLGRIEKVSLFEIFIIFGLISLIIFPLIFFMNKGVADSGFIFAFICLSMGVALRIVQLSTHFTTSKHLKFFKYLKIKIFIILSLYLLYTGYMWLGILGSVLFLSIIMGLILFSPSTPKTSFPLNDKENYSFGKKDIYYIVVLLLLNLISIRKLFTSQPIVFYDWSGFGKEVLDTLHFGVFPPNTHELFASPLILLIGNELANNVFLLAWIPIASITFYCFSVRIINNRTAAFIASFIYTFNPSVLDRFLSAHIGILIGYALMPLILMFFILSIESRNSWSSIIYSLISGVLLAISGLLQNHFFYIDALLIGLFLLFYSILNKLKISLKKGLSLIFLVFFTAIIIASPWLLSSIRLTASGYFSSIATLSYVDSLSTQTYLYNNLRLIGQSGGPFMENIGYLSLSFWAFMGFTIAIMGFSAHFLHKQDNEKNLLIFSSITLIGILLSTGTMYLSGLYHWLFINFPFFFAFREPSKFLIIASFGLSILVGITVDFILNIKGTRVLKILFVSALLLSQAIFAWPMFTGDNQLYTQHPKYNMPEEYRGLGAWMDSKNDNYKVMILPYTGFTIRTWHIVSKKPIVYIYNSLPYTDSDTYQNYIFMLETLGRGDAYGFSILAGFEEIKYIIIQKDMHLGNIRESPDDYNFIPPFNRFNLSGPVLYGQFDKSHEFKKTREFGPYIVFENQRFMNRTGKEKPVLAIGDRNLILEMAELPDYDKKELVFAYKLTPSELAAMIKNKTEIVSNYDENETLFPMLPEEYKINVYDYAFPAGLGDNPLNIIYKKWIRSDIFEFLDGGVFGTGTITYGRGYAITKGDAELSLTYSPLQNDSYHVWIRLFQASGRGNLSIRLDNEKYMDISHKSTELKGFKWVKVGEVNLDRRIYNVEIVNTNGENVIDQIAFVPIGYLATINYSIEGR